MCQTLPLHYGCGFCQLICNYTLSHRECGRTPSSPLSCNFCRLRDDFDDDGQLASIAPKASLTPTARLRQNHLEVCKSCMTKVTRVSTLSMGQTEHMYFYSLLIYWPNVFLPYLEFDDRICYRWRSRTTRPRRKEKHRRDAAERGTAYLAAPLERHRSIIVASNVHRSCPTHECGNLNPPHWCYFKVLPVVTD